MLLHAYLMPDGKHIISKVKKANRSGESKKANRSGSFYVIFESIPNIFVHGFEEYNHVKYQTPLFYHMSLIKDTLSEHA